MECVINTADSSECKTYKNQKSNNASIIHSKKLQSSLINGKTDVYKHGQLVINVNEKNILSSSKFPTNLLYKLIENKTIKNETLEVKRSRRLLSVETLVTICVWYFFTFLALFLSKHAIDFHSVDLLLFTWIQLLVSTFLSFMHKHLGARDSSHRPPSTHQFLFSMAFIGLMRAMVIYMGLLSMKWVALSFMETVKSSAPLFTLIISFLVLRERSGLLVQMSILPIMLGLFLCTAFEVSFNWIGFLAALAANLTECLQFVLSKIYLGGNLNQIDPADFQFYSSIAGLLTIFPLSPYLCDVILLLTNTTTISVIFMLVVGASYYLQTQMAWCLMQFLSPVTHSICNTIKCGMAVWLSIVIFGNEVSLWSGVGSLLVVAGVCSYQKARSVEKGLRKGVVGGGDEDRLNGGSCGVRRDEGGSGVVGGDGGCLSEVEVDMSSNGGMQLACRPPHKHLGILNLPLPSPSSSATMPPLSSSTSQIISSLSLIHLTSDLPPIPSQ